jgi:hypothetical protein
MSHFKTIDSMSSNDKRNLQKIERIQSFVASSFGTVDVPRKSIDSSTEVAEPHLLLEENAFSHSSIIAKDNDSKRVDTFLNTFKKEEQQPQKSSLPSLSRKSVHLVTTINTRPASKAISSEQNARRTVTFDDIQTPSHSISNRSIRTSYENLRLSNHDFIPDNQQEKESVNTSHLSETVINSGQMNLTTQDLNDLVSTKDLIRN